MEVVEGEFVGWPPFDWEVAEGEEEYEFIAVEGEFIAVEGEFIAVEGEVALDFGGEAMVGEEKEGEAFVVPYE